MKKIKKNCDLKSCSFCRLCLKEWLPAIDANRETLYVNKGEEFIIEGEKVTGVYFVNEGAVKVHKKWGEKELIVRFAKRGDIVGHRGLGNDIYYPVSATALEPSTVCFIPIEFFISSLKVNQEYLFQLMMFFAEELKVSERKMRNLAHMPVKGRVAQALLTLQEKFGKQENGFIDLMLSRQDLASYSGATYETVFRVLNELVEQNLVKLSGKSIAILDTAKLTVVTNLPE
ncbi:MAG TPA: Crp/Fnr family transcriptional regulator [Chitinophagaceae bacterium]|nr:Crp/Fnr family transcriptional regulator [Chitinophagaceae bacterium]